MGRRTKTYMFSLFVKFNDNKIYIKSSQPDLIKEQDTKLTLRCKRPFLAPVDKKKYVLSNFLHILYLNTMIQYHMMMVYCRFQYLRAISEMPRWGNTSWHSRKFKFPSSHVFYAMLLLTAALSSNTWGVMCHFQTNNPFSYRLRSSSAKVKAPMQHRGCWKHTTTPLFWEFLLEWTRFGLRLLFSFSCCSWGSFFPLPTPP